MMGRKMHLLQRQLDDGVGLAESLPQARKDDHHEQSQQLDGPMLSLLIDLDQTIKEGCEEEEPFQEGGNHDASHDGYIDNL
jgi:hypothetical protein